MDTIRQFEFFSKERRDPYIEKLLEFVVSETEGYIHFDGYYYVLNEEFPKRLFFNTTVREKEPYEEKIIDNATHSKFRVLEDLFYEVEVYDRHKLKSTCSYDEVEEDGEKMRICYFPTHEQKLFFRVKNKFDNFDDFLKRTTEYFTEEQTTERL